VTTFPHYRAVPIASPDGGNVWARAMNDRAQVVGSVYPESGAPHGFFWQNGRMTSIVSPQPQCPLAYPVDINNRGQVVGFLANDSEEGAPCNVFLWEHGRLTGLGFQSSTLLAINDHGQIVGSEGLWHDGHMTPLPGSPADINNRGQVAGMIDVSGVFAAFLWQRGRYRILTVPGSESLDVVDLNDRGWVLGRDYTAGATVLWNPRLTELSVPGDVSALNDAGQVVGTMWDSDFMPRGFLWRAGRVADLTALGGPAFPADINDRGQILGDVWVPEGSGLTAVYYPI
jgi:probable HAF family extracellular repeat protein